MNHWAPFEINGAVHIEARVYSLDSGWSRYQRLKRSARAGYSILRRLSANVALAWKSAKPGDPNSAAPGFILFLSVLHAFLRFSL